MHVSAVFVSRVKEDGAVAREGSIRKHDDELLSIDGVMLHPLDMPATEREGERESEREKERRRA